MFKVHVENTELLLEDCRAGANGWLRVSPSGQQQHHSAHSSGNASGGVDVEKIASVPDDKRDANFTPVHAVYGVYSLLSGPFLAVIADARVIGSGPNSEKIYCILELALLPVSAAAHRSFCKHASAREQADERAYIRMLESVLASRTFYFSYDYDLTLSMQRRTASLVGSSSSSSSNTGLSGSHKPLPMWQRADDDFFWNKPVLGAFIAAAGELPNWIVPVISGFVKVLKKCDVNGMRCDVLLFTRRSARRVGTRFTVRGVDKDGHVANFCETEMVVVRPNRSLCAYVQVRGSIPLYWDQMATLQYMPRTRYAFSGSNTSIVDWNELAFRAHMDALIQRYGHVTAVNLVDRTGTSAAIRDQAQLGTAFGKYVKKYNAQARASDPSGGAAAASFAAAAAAVPLGQSPKQRNGATTTPAVAVPATTATSASVSSAVGSAQSSPSSAASSGTSALSAAVPAANGPTANGPTAVSPPSGPTAAPTLSQLFAEPIAYVWFDFHYECRKLQWTNLSKLVADVHEQFAHYGWFETDSEGRLVSRQKGVFRVNCMDNLDRTNVVMSLFARRCTLQALGLYATGSHDTSSPSMVLDSPYEAFEVAFKNAWADNADYVSKMYAGTGALKTDFTRTGKRTLAGALQDGVNSVTRYYLNNFADGVRQDALDLLVANYVPDKRDESPFTFQQQHALAAFALELGAVALVVVGASVALRPDDELATRVRDGVVAAFALFAVTGYGMLKKGVLRALGRRYVCKPAFCSSGYIKRKDS